MIQTTTAANGNRIAAEAASSQSRRTASSNGATADFRALFSGTTASQTTSSTSVSGSATAAPQVSPPQTRAVATAASESAGSQSISTPAVATAAPDSAGGLSIFTPQAVENHMNEWLAGVLTRQNEITMQAYNNVLDGWKNTNARNRELGLPEVPPPPQPELASTGPMPEGWWFKITS